MRLAIQIPCYNEEGHLGTTISQLPRTLPGIDEIVVIVVDDGSTDRTRETAILSGAHVVVHLPHNQGLAAAYMAGIETCYQMGADFVVNTDADNQYCGGDIAVILGPVLSQQADLVVGDRETSKLKHFSLAKKLLQRCGTAIVAHISGVKVNDATSGFRAFNRRVASMQFIHNRFSYTLESLIQAGTQGLVVASVPVKVNPPNRPSRLFRTTLQYLRRSIPVVLRSYLAYSPGRTFTILAMILSSLGLIGFLRFLFYYVNDPAYNGHVQSLILSACSLTLAFISALLAAVGDLLAVNRRLMESILKKLRESESRDIRLWELGAEQSRGRVFRTSEEIWRPNRSGRIVSGNLQKLPPI